MVIAIVMIRQTAFGKPVCLGDLVAVSGLLASQFFYDLEERDERTGQEQPKDPA